MKHAKRQESMTNSLQKRVLTETVPEEAQMWTY